MVTIAISKVRQSMESKRKKFLKEYADTPKAVRFANDPEAFEFACVFYKYQYDAFNGNFPYLSEVAYSNYYHTFASKDSYDYKATVDGLKEDLANSYDEMADYLLDLAKKLRKRYGGK